VTNVCDPAHDAFALLDYLESVAESIHLKREGILDFSLMGRQYVVEVDSRTLCTVTTSHWRSREHVQDAFDYFSGMVEQRCKK
jgi:hypothetical protein